MLTLKNKLVCAVIPAFILAVSVGQIYAFTNFSTPISESIGESKAMVQFAFSLGIFFLGMGAAFFGKIVEKNIRLATIIGTCFFICGMVLSGLSVRYDSIPLLYLGYGFLVGLGTGVIYISPVKTMMLWFPNNKAIAAAVPIISFGLGSTLSTILYRWIEPFGIEKTFYIYAMIYLPMMALGCAMLKKPKPEIRYGGWHIEDGKIVANEKPVKKDFKYTDLIKNEFFIRSWVFMFLNISCGLMLIPLAKQMMASPTIGYSVGMMSLVIALCGVMNGGGRLVFAWASDKLNNRRAIMLYILGISAIVTASSFAMPVSIGISLLVINACYGAGFSVIPGILAEYFGMDNISKIHGAVLSAWGLAGIVGNQVAIFVSDGLGLGYFGVMAMLVILYVLNFKNALEISNNRFKSVFR